MRFTFSRVSLKKLAALPLAALAITLSGIGSHSPNSAAEAQLPPGYVDPQQQQGQPSAYPPPGQFPQSGQYQPPPPAGYQGAPAGYYRPQGAIPQGMVPGIAPGGGLPPVYHGQQYGYASPGGPAPATANEASKSVGALSVPQWFSRYDQIRHEAQMSPGERQKADGLMSHGLSLLVPGEEKIATKTLLSSLASRYQKACQQLRAMPVLAQTSNLHQSYYQYFANAGQLFSDYVRVQENIFAKDNTTGQPLAAGLLQRKQMLEGLEHQCKQIDAQTRAQFGINAYPW